MVLIGVDLVFIILNSIKKIEDTDYCVFSRILELCVGDKEKLFSISDIETSNSDGKCDYQEDEWKCTYLGQHEACTCNTEKVKLSFDNLTQKGVLKRVGNRWMLVN